MSVIHKKVTKTRGRQKASTFAAAVIGMLVLLAAVILAGGCGETSAVNSGAQFDSRASNTTTALSTTAGSLSRTTVTLPPTDATTAGAGSETFTRENWARLVSDPDTYKGARVDIVGKVFVGPEKDAKGTYWQMFCDPKNSEWNTVVYYADPDFRIAEGDYVHVIGEVKGKLEGTNAFGGTVTAVGILAEKAEVVEATAAASPAIRLVNLNLTRTQHRITVTLKKVEFAADETRVFMAVKNGSTETAHFYSFNSKMVQGEKQYDPESTGLSEYGEVQSDILPGVTSTGVIVFPAMDPHKATKVYLEIGSDNYSLDFSPCVFTVPAG